MNRPLLLAILVAGAMQAHAGEPAHERSAPEYVDGGRYACNKDSDGCAIIKQNNRRIIEWEIRRADRKSNRYETHARRTDSALTPRKGNVIYRSSGRLLDLSED
ncbi:hypothetical protein G5B35_10150 [Parapusillimonas sp. SGNA-6]|nr:hypothetical protein [Parapusillimonas sp. SGNA-6]